MHYYLTLHRVPGGSILACMGRMPPNTTDTPPCTWLEIYAPRDGWIAWQRGTDFGCKEPLVSPTATTLAAFQDAKLYFQTMTGGSKRAMLQADDRFSITAMAF